MNITEKILSLLKQPSAKPDPLSFTGEAPWVLAECIQAHPGLVMVITEDANLSSRLNLECAYILGDSAACQEFPDWETLPYDHFSPHEDIISDRLRLLSLLPSQNKGALFVSTQALMHRLCPRSHLGAHGLCIKLKDKLDLVEFRRQLESYGYRSVSQVYAHGEYALRGSILDLFPMGSDQPYRIDLFDNEIDSIRPFDVETQRSSQPIEQVSLLPAHEFSLEPDTISYFRSRWRAQFSGDPMLSPIYEGVSEGLAPAGIEYYLPLFFEQTATLFDYLPKNTLIIQLEHIPNKAEAFYQEILKRYDQYSHDVTRPLLPPNQVFLPAEVMLSACKQFQGFRLNLETTGDASYGLAPLPDLTIEARSKHPLSKLEDFILNNSRTIVFCAQSAGRRETLQELLQPLGLNPTVIHSWKDLESQKAPYILTTAPITQGIQFLEDHRCLITENDLLGDVVTQPRARRGKGTSAEHFIRNLVELEIGDAVVHEDHGIGRYQGLVTLNSGGVESEYLILTYANNDKIYVPVSNLQLISRYSGIDNESAPLSKLGSKTWGAAKLKAMEQVRDTAAELLNIYAKRKAKQGFIHKAPDAAYYAFANAFPFEETADQHRAIDEVIKDMTATYPMDRLICGDVGFGKTEVAMRAAFIAVNSGKQVAVLVPTTLLAQQHYETFKDRFAEHPINIQQISRFRSEKNRKETIEHLGEGKVDIVIGTHALLSQLVHFHDLGLVIIDEEHRFGVSQKEKLKALRTDVDILTMTATPIPRTLNLAMHGVRDLSIISTPPKRRLSIKTFVREYNPPLIREAILREILRGGQVYFLHNKVETIEPMARSIQALVPEARVQVAHGQLRERELEHIMSDFYHQRFNVLVCSTIIETGIDIPSANTILMDRADHLGLAQMHQLRGRVGRSHHQAYAYLLIPNFKSITPDAQKRLEAIESLEDLGAGFMLATHDLEIRGAGEILGEAQSGNIQSVGFSLYADLLERAVNSLQQGKEPDLLAPLHHQTEIDLKIPALIPEAYLPDVHSRLVFYKRISSCQTAESLREMQVEMIDRFGLLPEPLKNLFKVSELRNKAQPLGIVKIDFGAHGGMFEFDQNPQINTRKLIELLQNKPKIYKMKGQTRLHYLAETETTEQRLNAVSSVIFDLTPG